MKQDVHDTLVFVFTEVSTDASTEQSINVKFTNFFTPFSSQIIRTVNLRSFSDADCQNNMQTKSVQGPTILQDTLDSNSVSLSSSSNILGTTVATNALSVTFTPKTTMSPDGKGTVQIGVPMWWQIGITGERMYSPTATNKCTSSCMDITLSKLQDASILVEYSDMKQSCISKAPITITCKQFYNPITPEIWEGFQVTIYDSEADSRIIE
jgi:hypothetical protein